MSSRLAQLERVSSRARAAMRTMSAPGQRASSPCAWGESGGRLSRSCSSGPCALSRRALELSFLPTIFFVHYFFRPIAHTRLVPIFRGTGNTKSYRTGLGFSEAATSGKPQITRTPPNRGVPAIFIRFTHVHTSLSRPPSPRTRLERLVRHTHGAEKNGRQHVETR